MKILIIPYQGYLISINKTQTLPWNNRKLRSRRRMSSRSLGYIQEVGDDQSLIDCNSGCKRISDTITKNKLISEIDFFSLDVKFLIEGQENFRTIFSGLMGLAALIALGIITYFIAWPTDFSSKIVEIQFNQEANQTGQSLFTYADEPIGFSLVADTSIVPSQFAIKLYYTKTGQTPKEIHWDRNCKYEDYCLTKNAANGQILQLFGGSASSVANGSLTAEIFWCELFTPGCPNPWQFGYTFSFQNTYKKREKKLVPFMSQIKLPYMFGMFGLYILDFQVGREQFTSNNQILGLISNMLPETFYSYRYDQFPKSTTTFSYNKLITNTIAPQRLLFVANFVYSNSKYKIDEIFVNIITPILFLFSLLDPLKWLLNQILLRRYNKNCRDLYIANKLYYVEDIQNDEKYDFSQGLLVFLICLIHKHPLTMIFIKVLTFCGKNLVDIMPAKCIHIMNMINKGSSLMCENVFFGSLEELSTLEDCPGKKIPFDNIDLDDDDEEEEQQLEENYFPQSSIRRAAFVKFCKDNQYYSTKRKNKVYSILLDNKFTTFLKDGLHKQFENYVRNIENLKARGKFDEIIEDMNVPVQLSEHHQGKGDQTENGIKFSQIQQPS